MKKSIAFIINIPMFILIGITLASTLLYYKIAPRFAQNQFQDWLESVNAWVSNKAAKKKTPPFPFEKAASWEEDYEDATTERMKRYWEEQAKKQKDEKREDR